MEIIGILLLVVAFITAIGHGLWLFIAWILRGCQPARTQTQFEPTLTEDGIAAARYAKHLHARQLLDASTFGQLMRAINTDFQSRHQPPQLQDAAVERPTAPDPPSTPAVEAAAPAPPPTTAIPPVKAAVPAPRAAEFERAAEMLSSVPPPKAHATPPPSPAPPRPRRSFGEVMVGFMAERNIRWGELVGGLLILGSSTALVISLWSQIEAIPLLKFAIFTTVTTALFGAGLFVQHRWKLPTTGRTLLIIATLLVPLNLLAFAAFSGDSPSGAAWSHLIEWTSVGLFAWLTWQAGRVLAPDGPRLFAAGVIVTSSTALGARLLVPQTAAALFGTAALPVGVFATIMGTTLWRYRRKALNTDGQAKPLVLQLGVQALSCIAPFGLVIHMSGDLTAALRNLAPLISVMAAPALIVGVLLWKRLANGQAPALRTGAAAIAAVAALIMLVAGLAGEPSRITWMYALYALAAFVATAFSRSGWATWCGTAFAQVAAVSALVYAWPVNACAWPTAVLACASAALAAAVLVPRLPWTRPLAPHYRPAWLTYATWSAAAAVAWLLLAVFSEPLTAVAWRLLWAAALWLALAALQTNVLAFAGSQAAMWAGGCVFAHSVLQNQSWLPTGWSMCSEPRMWQTHLLITAAMALGWGIARWLIAGRGIEMPQPAGHEAEQHDRAWHTLLHPRPAAFDHVLAIVGVLGMTVLALWSLAPGLAGEHGVAHGFASALHSHAAGAGSWLLLGTLGAAFVCRLAPPIRKQAAAGLMILTACSTALIAARFEQQLLVGTVWRSLLAVVGVAPAALAVVVSTSPTKSRLPTWLTLSDMVARRTWLAIFGIPVVVLTATTVLTIGADVAVLPSGISDAGLRLVVLGPLGLVCAALVCFGLQAQQRSLGSWAAALTGLATAWMELALLGRAGMGITPSDIVWLVQLNAIVLTVLAAVWMALDAVRPDNQAPTAFPVWPALIARTLLGVVALLAGASIWLSPGSIPPAVGALGNVWGVLAVALLEGMIFLNTPARERRWAVHIWGVFVIMLAASALQSYDTGNWLCFHALSIGVVLLGALHVGIEALRSRQVLGAGWHETLGMLAAGPADADSVCAHDLSCASCEYNLRGLDLDGSCPECGTPIEDSTAEALRRLTPGFAGGLARQRDAAAYAVSTCAVLCALFALRAVFDDPQRPWWSVSIMVLSAVLCMVYGALAPRRVFAYWGGLAACLATSLWFFQTLWQPSTWLTIVAGGVYANVCALVVCGLLWFWIERRFILGRVSDQTTVARALFHRTVATWTPQLCMIVACVALLRLAFGDPLHGLAWTGTPALLGTAACVIIMRRDATVSTISVRLMTVGIAGIALVFSQTNLPVTTLAAGLAAALTAYALLAAASMRMWLRLPGSTADSAWPTTTVYVLLLSALSAGLSVYAVLSHPAPGLRIMASAAVLVAAVAVTALLRGALANRLRVPCLACFGCGVVLLSWSFVAPGSAAAWMHRAVGVIVSWALLVSVAAFIAGHFDSWRHAIQRSTAAVCVLAGMALSHVFVVDLQALFDAQIPPLAGAAVWAVLLSLSMIIVWCVAFAVWPRFDVLSVAPKARGAYIYVAEALGVVLGVHIRATMPWLFHGFVTQFWPILVLGIAVLGMVLAEFCRRQNLLVLSRPFMRTGLILPAVAACEILIQASRVHGSLVLLAVGALYVVLAVRQRSFGLGLLATAALNGSLWFVLYQTPGYGLAQHPQLWFIPLALAVLAAGKLNQAQLSEAQRTWIHYACLLAIYLSSTADIFLIGVAEAPWLPLVLAGLSIAGIFMGLANRVQSYLFLGTGFLCLALLTMMWHAATNLGWTWVWYVAGIALGIAIITVFAMFEKKRHDVTALIGEVRDWSG